MSDKEAAEVGLSSVPLAAACPAGWLVPGLWHFLLGRRWRGIIFFVVVNTLFAAGLWLEGELFPLDPTRPLTLLAGLAEMGVGLPYFLARLVGLGAGRVESITYEYGYTFAIVAGLLNFLILLDAYDISTGRKK
jgi:hypothetical protein